SGSVDAGIRVWKLRSQWFTPIAALAPRLCLCTSMDDKPALDALVSASLTPRHVGPDLRLAPPDRPERAVAPTRSKWRTTTQSRRQDAVASAVRHDVLVAPEAFDFDVCGFGSINVDYVVSGPAGDPYFD